VVQWFGSADPDPYQNVMDPEHWYRRVCAKMTLKCELLKVIILRLLRMVRAFFRRFLVSTKLKKEYTVPLFYMQILLNTHKRPPEIYFKIHEHVAV
jgi:hypothetical protein